MQASICTVHPITSIKEELAFHWAPLGEFQAKWAKYSNVMVSEWSQNYVKDVYLWYHYDNSFLLLLRLLTFTCCCFVARLDTKILLLWVSSTQRDSIYLIMSCESERARIEHVLSTNTIMCLKDLYNIPRKLLWTCIGKYTHKHFTLFVFFCLHFLWYLLCHFKCIPKGIRELLLLPVVHLNWLICWNITHSKKLFQKVIRNVCSVSSKLTWVKKMLFTE